MIDDALPDTAVLPGLSSAWDVLRSGLTEAESRLLVLAYSWRRLYVPADAERAAGTC